MRDIGALAPAADGARPTAPHPGHHFARILSQSSAHGPNPTVLKKFQAGVISSVFLLFRPASSFIELSLGVFLFLPKFLVDWLMYTHTDGIPPTPMIT